MNLRLQIIALAIIPLVVAILSVTIFITWQSTSLVRSSIDTFEQNMLKSKETEIINLTTLAMSAINTTYLNAGADDEDAKRKVTEILKGLDYGQDGYFFVYDYDGNSIVHPRQEFRSGHNWLNITDPDGDHVIANLIAAAKAGGGLHQYKWEKPSTGKLADKLSFVTGLDKWKWVLGTGAYLDDVFAQTAAAKAELRQSIGNTFLIVALVAVPATIIVFSTCMLITLRERRLADTKLKRLTQRVIDTQEEERARISRELHDGISQNLVGVRYAMDLARRKVATGSDQTAIAIDSSIEALNSAIKEVRGLSHGLRPRVLDDLGLAAALTALCNNFLGRTGVDTDLTAAGFLDDLKPEASTALYRVAQEAFNNIERHAKASKVSVRIWSEKGRARLSITDDGVGFAKDSAHDSSGLGLRNMQERMAHFGGLLLVRSEPGRTVLTALLPKSASVYKVKAAAVA
ncbi:cache domain-containing protein [Phyllobacterium sp. YR531]|uniref:cache domain-containing protein n=1 Tax=Phyllobacterium sp. YR531 TaxID=1144343 RepID=UPI00026F529C|nr:cache domain-containing protein [Phyllobacterium sp. YR531]EJN02465.1 signal transduction histidine kinase [Phyllobacterium sp. YR531]